MTKRRGASVRQSSPSACVRTSSAVHEDMTIGALAKRTGVNAETICRVIGACRGGVAVADCQILRALSSPLDG